MYQSSEFCFDKDQFNKRKEIKLGSVLSENNSLHFTLDLLDKSILLFKNKPLTTMSLLHVLMLILIYYIYNICT